MSDTDRLPPPAGVFFSTATYALGKELGFEGAEAELLRQCADPMPDSLAVARTIARLRYLEPFQLWHDCSSTYIGKSRSRAYFEALRSSADVWMMCDDDVEADTQTLQWLIAAVRSVAAPCVCLAPCVTRGSTVVNVALDRAGLDARELPGGGRTVRALAGGFGLVAMNRAALERMADRYRDSLSFYDDDGQTKIAIFLEALIPQITSRLVIPRQQTRLWTGEDVAFCHRAIDAGVRLEALVSGVTAHDGVALRLESVPALGELERPELAG